MWLSTCGKSIKTSVDKRKYDTLYDIWYDIWSKSFTPKNRCSRNERQYSLFIIYRVAIQHVRKLNMLQLWKYSTRTKVFIPIFMHVCQCLQMRSLCINSVSCCARLIHHTENVKRDRKENEREAEMSSYLTLLQFVIVAAGLHDSMSPEEGAGEDRASERRGAMTRKKGWR